MIPVGMGEDEVVITKTLSQQILAQSPDPGPCIDDDDAAVLCADLDAGRVSAVLDVFLAADRDGTPGAPDFDEHDLPSRRQRNRYSAPRCGLRSSLALSISLSICFTSSLGLSNFISSRIRSMKRTSMAFP